MHHPSRMSFDSDPQTKHSTNSYCFLPTKVVKWQYKYETHKPLAISTVL
jgi:hypothetical protein